MMRADLREAAAAASTPLDWVFKTIAGRNLRLAILRMQKHIGDMSALRTFRDRLTRADA